MTNIPFNIPPYVGTEIQYVQEAVDAHKICGDGQFTKKCNAWIEKRFGAVGALLTTSGTTALEMAALLCGLEKGDEVILPSFTFSSTATSIVLTGATPVFIDIRPDTMNIDETRIEAAITDKTKAIVAVHYAGVSCEMDTIMEIARRHGLKVIEDAAQGVMSTYKGRALGTIGDFGCYPAEILREKGTDRARFFRGQVDKYTWVEYGSSYLPSDMLAAYLWAQLQEADRINENRLATWNAYNEAFSPLAAEGKLILPTIPEECKHNAHMYYVKLKDLRQRTDFINYLRDRGISSVFHYVPLHSSPAGRRFGRFCGEDVYTTSESDRLTRLPMYYGLSAEDRGRVIDAVLSYFA